MKRNFLHALAFFEKVCYMYWDQMFPFQPLFVKPPEIDHPKCQVYVVA